MAPTDFSISRFFDAPRELVFQVWTDPAHVINWWGPQHFTAPVCKIDFRPGGTFHFCMRSPDGNDYWNIGVYQEIVIPEKIVSTMYFSDEAGNRLKPSYYGFGPDFPAEMVDIVTFTEDGPHRTKLTLERNTPESVAKRYMMDQGWQQSLERMAEVVKLAQAEFG